MYKMICLEMTMQRMDLAFKLNGLLRIKVMEHHATFCPLDLLDNVKEIEARW